MRVFCLFSSNKFALPDETVYSRKEKELVGLEKMLVDFDMVIQKRMDTKIKRTINKCGQIHLMGVTNSNMKATLWCW